MMLLSRRDWICAGVAAAVGVALCMCAAFVLRSRVAEYAEFDLSTVPSRVETAVAGGRFEEARDICRTALNIDHGNAHVHLLYVYTLIEEGEKEHLVTDALELARFNADIRIKEGHYTNDILRLVNAFEKMTDGQWDESLELFESLEGTKWSGMPFVQAAERHAAEHASRKPSKP